MHRAFYAFAKLRRWYNIHPHNSRAADMGGQDGFHRHGGVQVKRAPNPCSHVRSRRKEYGIADYRVDIPIK